MLVWKFSAPRIVFLSRNFADRDTQTRRPGPFSDLTKWRTTLAKTVSEILCVLQQRFGIGA
jgi:hypothetical protein